MGKNEPVAVTQAITGMGGLGKTTLAQQYAHENREKYAGVWWINVHNARDDNEGKDVDNLIAGLSALGDEIFVNRKTQASNETSEDRARAALKYLCEHSPRWLVIYDNVDSFGLIKDWLPSGNCDVIITTREQHWDGQAKEFCLDCWSDEKGKDYLQKERKVNGSVEDLKALSEVLGGLPLALDHAASYLWKKQLSNVKEYLDNVRDKIKSYPKNALYPKSVYATFELALERIKEEKYGNEALEWLDVFAQLAPAPLDQALCNELCETLCLDEAGFALVTRKSLILGSNHGNTRTFLMHRLVSEVARDQQTDQEQVRAKVIKFLASKIKTVAPDSSCAKDQKIYELLRPHILRFENAEFPTQETKEEHITILMRLAGYAESKLEYSLAERLYTNCKKRASDLPISHEIHSVLFNNLASLFHDMGRYAEAEPLYKKALQIREKTLGPDHPDTASSLNNLASLYHAMGRYTEAEPLHKRALEIRKKTLGPDHPDTVVSLNNLAGLYQDMGRYAEAEPLYIRALETREKTFEPEHPDTAVSLNNLASLYQDMGRYAEAEPLFERALEIREKTFGPEHPDTALSLNNLALLYKDTARYDKAKPLFKRALKISEKTLGPEHPITATTLNNLASIHQAMGRYTEAEPLCERALEIRERTLGPEHPDTAVSLNNLAMLYHAMGRYKEAEPLFLRALEIRERTLGPEHPDTAVSLNNLAGLYQDMGRYKEAEPLYIRALGIRKKTLGPDHPFTGITLNNLAMLYHAMGRGDEAMPLLKKAFEILKSSLGEGHPETLIVALSLQRLKRDK